MLAKKNKELEDMMEIMVKESKELRDKLACMEREQTTSLMKDLEEEIMV